MDADIERWNRKYQRGNPNSDFEPDPILPAYKHLLHGTGTGLDVACGVGHNARFLAQLGYEMVGVDGSVVGLQYGRDMVKQEHLPIALIATDLEQFAAPGGYFDLILVVRFLDRALIPRLKYALSEGGILIYKTFNRNWLLKRPDFPAHYVLEQGELACLFQDFKTLATNDSPLLVEPETFWIGLKP